jgi:hypothetical protein
MILYLPCSAEILPSMQPRVAPDATLVPRAELWPERKSWHRAAHPRWPGDGIEKAAGCTGPLSRTKRVDDAEAVVEYEPVLHFGTHRIAVGAERRGGDHRVPDR